MITKLLKAEAALLGASLVVYLFLIARELRGVARTVRLVSVGLRAIEKQTEPIRERVDDLNENLERSAALLAQLEQRRTQAKSR